jgi:hydrogenase/urease accessory protein HupE
MKPTPRRLLPVIALFCWLCSVASAHPGHGDDHDFSWDFDHLVEHPVATIAWLAVFGVALWAIVRVVRSVRSEGEDRRP